MKTLVLLTLVSVALAAPALPEGDTENLQHPQLQVHRSIPEFVKREKKSPTELVSTLEQQTLPDNEEVTDVNIPIQTARSFSLKKPIIVKKKHGYHLYRDSEEEKANADSHEQCGRQVKVKLCDGDGKFREMLRKSGHDISDSVSENDMKHSIMMAREAIENLQRDFKRMEQNSAGSGKLVSNADTDLHEDIEITRQALDDIHKNFDNLETMSLRATTLEDNDAIKKLHISIASSSEEEKLAQWKTAIDNIHKNVEIAQNIENSFKNADDQEKSMHLHQIQSSKTDHEITEEVSHAALEGDHMRNVQNKNLAEQDIHKIDDVQGPQTTFGHAREQKDSLEDIATSASEAIEMKAVDIPSHHSLTSENHKRADIENDNEMQFKAQVTDVHNRNTNNKEVLDNTGTAPSIEGLSELLRKTEVIDLDEKVKELHHTKGLEENNIKNEINDPMTTSSVKSIENERPMLEDQNENSNGEIQSISRSANTLDSETIKQQFENSMRTADPLILNEIHVEGTHHNIDYNESDHTVALTETKSAEENWQHENTPMNLMKTAEPLDTPLNDMHIPNKQHSIDYNESEHTAALTEMKAAESTLNHRVMALDTLAMTEDNLHHPESERLSSNWNHEASWKTSALSDQENLHNLNLLHKSTDENDKPENTATITEMKTAENNLNAQPTVVKALEVVEDNLHEAVSLPFNSLWDHQTRPLTALKTANPSDQMPLNDIHLEKMHQNLDSIDSEHKATLIEMKTAGDNDNLQLTVPKTMESEALTAPWNHGIESFGAMKTSEPINPQDELNLQHTLQKNVEIEPEHMQTFEHHHHPHHHHHHQLKESASQIHSESATFKHAQVVGSPLLHPKIIPTDSNHESRKTNVMNAVQPLEHLQHNHHDTDYSETQHMATLTKTKSADVQSSRLLAGLSGMKAAENDFHPAESVNVQDWNEHMIENEPSVSMKMADSTPMMSLQQHPSHLDVSEHIADMKAADLHPHLMATDMKAVEAFHRQAPTKFWSQDSGFVPEMRHVEDLRQGRLVPARMRNSHEHHFIPNTFGHRFDSLEHNHHHHAHYPHKLHHNLPHSDIQDINVHGGISSHLHTNLRDAMEDLESEHEFRWKPSHESFRSSYGANPISSGGAVGVFPNANTGGCGIPLLLSCSPSVVSGSLAKAHGTSFSAPYSAPSYRSEEDFGFHNKRDTKKATDMRNNNVLRSSTIVKQKSRTISDSKI